METRGATQAAGISIENLLGGGIPGAIQGIASPLQRLGTQAQQNLLAQQLGNQNLGAILGGALQDPASQASEVGRTLQPFEQRQTRQQVAGLRGSFGQMGGRFSEGLLGAESQLRGELSNQFARNRGQLLSQFQQNRNQALGTTLQGLLGAQELGAQQGLGGLRQLLGFIQPGPPVIQQGLGPGLLQAGAQLGSAALLSGSMGGGGGS